MKVTEIEIGVVYQARSRESVRASVRVEPQEGDTIEDAPQWAAEKAAEIATNKKPGDYADCLELLGREVSEVKLEKMRFERE